MVDLDISLDSGISPSLRDVEVSNLVKDKKSA